MTASIPKGLKVSSPGRTALFLRRAETIDSIETVADVAEVTPDRLQIAYLNGEREMVDGQIFGACGDWKIWLEHPKSGIETHVGTYPITLPSDVIAIDGGKTQREGRLKRLKRADL
jgi:hypothetical protein